MTLIQIYYSAIFIWEKFENNQIQLNTDLFTVSIQIMWDSLIFTNNLSFVITIEIILWIWYEFYGFFALFSIYQLRISFLSWRRRYKEWLFENIYLLRKTIIWIW